MMKKLPKKKHLVLGILLLVYIRSIFFQSKFNNNGSSYNGNHLNDNKVNYKYDGGDGDNGSISSTLSHSTTLEESSHHHASHPPVVSSSLSVEGDTTQQQRIRSKDDITTKANTATTTKTTTKTNTILSFVRIPKTGSTSMMRFLKYHSGLKSLVDGANERRNIEKLMTGCFFGNFSSISISKNNTDNNVQSGCSHRQLRDLQNQWNTIQFDYNSTYQLQYFTMLREPFEHMKSWFYYKRQFVDKESTKILFPRYK